MKIINNRNECQKMLTIKKTTQLTE
ncbi:MAG: GNAT family N-acetyltransferase, partial [Enterococcus faecalis]|nr:GNAT family N-acetyltransferase [Enterococcus faecalis]